ncbi:hypothetical protein [Lysobacter sp. HA35]
MDIASLGIKVTTDGVAKAEQELSSLTRTGAKTANSAKEIAKAWAPAVFAGAAAGIGVLGLAMTRYVQNTIEAEKAQAQLVARLKSTNGAAGLALADLNRLADGLQRVTTFDDESIAGVESLLLTFTKIGRDVFPRATEAVLDMSIALGGDLKGAAVQLGKALNDPVEGVTALSRAGVQFTDKQKDMIQKLVETNRLAEAQAIVLKELESQMGGSARAARDTLGGALESLKNSFDNLLEGDGGTSGVHGARDAIESLNNTLNDPGIKSGVGDLVDGMLRVADMAVTVAAKVGEATAALRDFFAENSKKSDAALENRRQELWAVEIPKAQGDVKRPGLYGTAPDPISKLLGIPTGQDKVDALRKELAGIEALQAQRSSASMFDNVVGGTSPSRPPPKGTLGSTDSKSAARPSVSEANAVEQAYQRINKQLAEQIALFGKTGEAARLRYATESGELSKLPPALKDQLVQRAEYLDSLEREQDAMRESARLADEEGQRLDRERESRTQLLGDMQFELDLTRMTNQEKNAAIAIRNAHAEGINNEDDAIRDYLKRIDEAAQQQRVLDDVRGSAEDMFASFIDGSRSAGDAFEDFAKNLQRIAARLLAQKAVEWLLSSFMGGGGAASAGGTFAGFWGGGSGFSSGGYTGTGGKYQPAGVVHKGEGVLSQEDIAAIGGPSGFHSLRRAIHGGGYANGGIAGQFAAPVGSSRGAPAVQVLVENHSGGQARTEETTGPDGGRMIRVIVEAAVSEVDRRIGTMGSTGRSIQARFGVSPAAVPRG